MGQYIIVTRRLSITCCQEDLEPLISPWNTESYTFVAAWDEYVPTLRCGDANSPLMFCNSATKKINMNCDEKEKCSRCQPQHLKGFMQTLIYFEEGACSKSYCMVEAMLPY